VNVTISNNSLKEKVGLGKGAGGISVTSGALTAMNVTVTGNNGGSGGYGGLEVVSGLTAYVGNTIFANNVTGDCHGTIASTAPNLIENPGGCAGSLALGNLTGLDPNLGPLQDNGGFTKTHALLLGSVAIDMGANASCPSVDQRGKPRPVKGWSKVQCDMGAYEVQ